MAKKKKKGKQNIYCDPGICDRCLYIGGGDSICDITYEIVLDDWAPTDSYMGKHCPHNKGKK